MKWRCCIPGCENTAEGSSYCKDHTKPRQFKPKQRRHNQRRGRRWRNLRTHVLDRESYRCEECGKVCDDTPGSPDEDKPNVHHIDPIEDGGGDELANLQLLCGHCHTAHHAKEAHERSRPPAPGQCKAHAKQRAQGQDQTK